MTRLRLWPVVSLAAVAWAASLAGERSALAEAGPSRVVLLLEQCDETLAAEARRIVGVELRATIIAASDVDDSVTRVTVTCRGPDIDLSLEAAAHRLYRTLALSEAAPTAWARLVALAVAELVVASWQGSPAVIKPEEPSVTVRQPPAPVLEIASPVRVSAMADAIGVVRVLPGSGLWLLGAGARGVLTTWGPFTLLLDLTGEWGRASRTTGQVAARTIGGGLGLGWGVQRKHLFILPWVGARAGVARLMGEPSPRSTITLGETQSGPWLSPEIGASLTLFPHAPVHVTVALSGGVMLLGVRGEVTGDRSVNTLGPWAAMVVGLGLSKR